jgi:hypothetical protein
MYRSLIIFVLLVGCASFKPVDLRPDDPPELGDEYTMLGTEVRYRVVEIDGGYAEATTMLTCVNNLSDSRARCRDGDICLSMVRVSRSVEGQVDKACMRQEHVMDVYRIHSRGNQNPLRMR